jgi:hypothetical protein
MDGEQHEHLSLSSEQVAHFRRDGYVILRHVFDPTQYLSLLTLGDIDDGRNVFFDLFLPGCNVTITTSYR